MHVAVTAKRSIDVKGLPGFLAWAKRDAPGLYAHLVNRIPQLATIGAPVGHGLNLAGLGDISDLFDSIGSTVADAFSSGGLIQNLVTIAAPVAQTYMSTQTQQAQLNYQSQLAQAQLSRARQGYAPLQTGYTSTGYSIALPTGGVVQPGQLLQLPPSAVTQLPSGVSASLPFTTNELLLGGGLLALLVFVLAS
jgi:hypothetical protein